MPLSRGLLIEEVDGSPSGVARKLVVSNGALSLSGATATVTTGGVSGTAEPIELVINGNGSAITTGIVRGAYEVKYACTITAVRLFADVSGSIVVDIWKDSYANYPPSVADTITASAKPTLSSATKAQDTTLTGWTTALAAGDVIYLNVDSASTVTWVLLALTVTRT